MNLQGGVVPMPFSWLFYCMDLRGNTGADPARCAPELSCEPDPTIGQWDSKCAQALWPNFSHQCCDSFWAHQEDTVRIMARTSTVVGRCILSRTEKIMKHHMDCALVQLIPRLKRRLVEAISPDLYAVVVGFEEQFFYSCEASNVRPRNFHFFRKEARWMRRRWSHLTVILGAGTPFWVRWRTS